MLGEISWLTWKSRDAQQKELEEYTLWAFPYGDAQREKITTLLHELFPHESESVALVAFLTCKELFTRSYKDPKLFDFALDSMKKGFKRYKKLIPKKYAPICMALVIADVHISEALLYPSADDIIAESAKYQFTDAKK